MSSGRAPVSPDIDAVKKQYGEDAELYAEVRAETARAIGREGAAKQWEDVEADVGRDGEEVAGEGH